MEALIIIYDRAYTKQIKNLFSQVELTYSVSFYGKGTATSEVLAYFGLHESEKEVVVAIAETNNARKCLELVDEFSKTKKHSVVGLCVPVDSIGKNTLDYLTK